MKENYIKKTSVGTVETNLDIYLFKEDNIFYVHAPTVDITGYGYTQKEAEDSFSLMVEEYYNYPATKNEPKTYRILGNILKQLEVSKEDFIKSLN